MEDHVYPITKTSTKASSSSSHQQPHVVIFPLPIQGPVKCMLKLSQLILSLGHPSISVTFLTTDYIYRRLHLHPTLRCGSESKLRFETVADPAGPDEDPGRSRHVADITIFLENEAKTEGSRLREVLAYGSAERELRKPVTCIIADGLFGCMVDVAAELKVPLVYAETISPCGLWTYLCIPNMLQAAHLPFQGMEEEIIRYNKWGKGVIAIICELVRP